MSLVRIYSALNQLIINKLGDVGGPSSSRVDEELNNIISFANRGLRSIHSDPVTRATINNTTETDFSSTTIAANELSADGDYFLVISNVFYAANANNKRFRIDFGGNAIFDGTNLPFNNARQMTVGLAMRRATTFMTSIFLNLTTGIGGGSNVFFSEFGSVNYAIANTLKSTGQNGAPGVANDIEQRGFVVIKGSA